MKRDKAMNIVRKGGLKSGGLKSNGLKFSRLKSVCLTLTVLTPAAACEQPFKAGFGPVVDTRPPTIVLDSPGAGMYLTGTPVFMGHAEDDYKLNSVFLRVTNYPDSYPLTSYQKVALVNGRWSLPIDTTQYDDGDFMIQLMVRDSLNKQVETDNIAFFVKNGPPLVRMVMPAIAHTSENP